MHIKKLNKTIAALLSVTMLTPVNIMAAENQDSIVYTEQGETVPLKKRRQTTEMECRKNAKQERDISFRVKCTRYWRMRKEL